MDNLSTFAQMGIVAGTFMIFPLSIIIAILFIIRSQARAEARTRPRRRRRPLRSGKPRLVAKWPARAANDD